MIIKETLGNLTTDAEKYASYTIDKLHLEQWEATKSRIKKLSHLGTEVAISLDRGNHLHNKDILFVDDEKKVVIIVDILLKNVLKITLPENITLETLFKLGHALGNQHWPAILQGKFVYVPLYVAEGIMRSMLRTHNFTDMDIEFIDGDSLSSVLNAADFRLLFSGDDTTAHKH